MDSCLISKELLLLFQQLNTLKVDNIHDQGCEKNILEQADLTAFYIFATLRTMHQDDKPSHLSSETLKLDILRVSYLLAAKRTGLDQHKQDGATSRVQKALCASFRNGYHKPGPWPGNIAPCEHQ